MEKVKVFLKQDLDSLVAHSGRHRRDLAADKVDHLTTLDKTIASKEITFAENVTWCVGKAIQECSDKSRKILTDAYLKRQLDKITMVEMGYGSTRYYELKQIALTEFMENFAKYQKQIGLEPAFKLVK
ncbi:hypothetical protein [Lactobacillus sp. ESL0228]|uniref:hypothetical protein n=1 Tax=Lactobacillus sp. ESL0228 TaxID=2069352 RepID=UPI000EFAD6F2|nr:hypothetical protein [Lactobacillus sp. ESL0228]RMC49753.1 hypothetical protein F5ESL0228_03275 [Lactobacillus sp. ESL0228]